MFVPSLTENLEIVAESRGPCVFLRYVQHWPLHWMCAFLGDRDRNKEMRDRRFSEVLRSASERGDVTWSRNSFLWHWRKLLQRSWFLQVKSIFYVNWFQRGRLLVFGIFRIASGDFIHTKRATMEFYQKIYRSRVQSLNREQTYLC